MKYFIPEIYEYAWHGLSPLKSVEVGQQKTKLLRSRKTMEN